jgi:hypothetical protein
VRPQCHACVNIGPERVPYGKRGKRQHPPASENQEAAGHNNEKNVDDMSGDEGVGA